MNFTTLTGLLVPLAAVIWFFVFLPAKLNGAKVEKNPRQARTKSRVVEKQATKTTTQSNAEQLFRLSTSRKLIALGMALSLVVLAIAVNDFSKLWWLATAATTSLILTIILNRKTNKNLNQLLASSLKHRTSAVNRKSNSLKQISEPLQSNSRAWVPVDLPAPMHLLNRQGQLENPVLAEVKELRKPDESSAPQNVSITGQDLNEILLRRRAN